MTVYEDIRIYKNPFRGVSVAQSTPHTPRIPSILTLRIAQINMMVPRPIDNQYWWRIAAIRASIRYSGLIRLKSWTPSDMIGVDVMNSTYLAILAIPQFRFIQEERNRIPRPRRCCKE